MEEKSWWEPRAYHRLEAFVLEQRHGVHHGSRGPHPNQRNAPPPVMNDRTDSTTFSRVCCSVDTSPRSVFCTHTAEGTPGTTSLRRYDGRRGGCHSTDQGFETKWHIVHTFNPSHARGFLTVDLHILTPPSLLHLSNLRYKPEMRKRLGQLSFVCSAVCWHTRVTRTTQSFGAPLRGHTEVNAMSLLDAAAAGDGTSPVLCLCVHLTKPTSPSYTDLTRPAPACLFSNNVSQ